MTIAELKTVSDAELKRLYDQAVIDLTREASLERDSEAHQQAFAGMCLILEESKRRVLQ